MANRLSPEEIRRIQAQEKLVKEINEILYQNYNYVLNIPQVVKAINEGNADFSFVKDKIVRKLLQKSLKTTHGKISIVLLNSIKKEWSFAQENFWNGFKTRFSKEIQQMQAFEKIKTQAETFSKNNAADSLNFYNQKRNGLNISDRIWNMTKAIPKELEVMVQNAVKEGKSTADLARELRKNLNEPDRIYRRVRNKKTGQLELSEAARKYNPGQGVYRSSVKNAERLARTEINRAYRYAEWQGYQKNDMIIGYEIRVSNNSENRCQTCVDLQGNYPKWFLWTGWHPQCYSDDTELMTDKGWKLFEELEKDDKIFSLNPETKIPEWVGFTKFIKYHRKGKMYRFHNRNLDMLVTPDHKMVYLNKSDGKTLMDNKVAEDFKPTMGGLYRSSEYEGERVDNIKIGNHVVNFDVFVEFMAYYLAEGSLFWTRVNQIKISQCKIKHHEQYVKIRKCLEKMPFKFSEIQGGFYSNDPHFYEYLKQFGKSPEKHIPEIIKNSSIDQMRLFLDSYVICDGHTRKAKPFIGNRGGSHIPKNDEKVYFTSSKKMEADIGELLVKIGKRPSHRFSAKKGDLKLHRNGSYETKNDNVVISECNSKTATVYQKSEVDYDGFVYDIELERNHIFYVRRNGKCVWGSNCRCRMIPILSSQQDFKDEIKALFGGPVYKPKFIEKLPANFVDYLEKNGERIKNASTLPYWYEDNLERIKEILSL